MALIKCPECGRENVSDSAEVCPDCGYGIKAHFEKEKQEEEQKRKEEARRKQEEERRIILEKAREEERQKRIKEKQKETDETIEKLQANAKENRKAAMILLVWSIIWTVILVLSIVNDLNGLITALALICSIGGWFIFFVSWGASNDSLKDIELAQNNIDEYESVKLQRAETAYKAAQINDARRKEEEALKHPKCPKCGSTNTQIISTLNRAVSISTVGLASSKIGKQYECKKCKHKW